jgi:hypothetical protein
MVRACSSARNTEPRTGSRRSHRADGRPATHQHRASRASGGHARCRLRHPVRGCAPGARLLRRTEHGTSHRLTTHARCGREARGGPAPRLPAGGGRARCGVRRPVRGCALGARLLRRTGHGTSHRLATHARCGREARGGPAPRLPGQRRPRTVPAPPSGARLRARCAPAPPHGTRNLAPARDARTVQSGGPWRGRTGPPVRPWPRPPRDTRCPGPPAGPATVVDTPWPP